MPSTGPTLTERVQAAALELGFDQAGIAKLGPSDHEAFYHHWLEQGYHGDMGYLARRDAVEKRVAPDAAWPALKSALVVAHGYYREDRRPTTDDRRPGGASFAAEDEGDRGSPIADRRPDEAASAPEDERSADGADAGSDRRSSVVGHRSPPHRGGTGIIARYARGRDYHKVVKKKLLRLLRRIEDEIGRALPEARAYVDTGPVLERELARRAGLGWFGRNTMMIHPRRGSYFFLGVLLLPLELEAGDEPVRDHCGTCTACLDACPTGALLGRDENGAPVMDATRCISYLTIENRGPIPEELRPLMGNRVYGCDICQEVCPFSRKFSAPASEPAYAARSAGEPPFGVQPEPGSSSSHPGTASPSLIELLETALDEASWDSFSRGSAIRRAGRAGFARNVCVGLGNWGSPEAVPVLSSALSDPEPLVRAHAAWALGRVDAFEAKAALEGASSSEADPFVREELGRALEASPIVK